MVQVHFKWNDFKKNSDLTKPLIKQLPWIIHHEFYEPLRIFIYNNVSIINTLNEVKFIKISFFKGYPIYKYAKSTT